MVPENLIPQFRSDFLDAPAEFLAEPGIPATGQPDTQQQQEASQEPQLEPLDGVPSLFPVPEETTLTRDSLNQHETVHP